MSHPRVELIEYGIFEVRSVKKILSELSLIGHEFVDAELKLLRGTDKIPLDAGLCFGIKYSLSQFAGSYFTCRLLHPEVENSDRLGFTQTLVEKEVNSAGVYNDFVIFEFNWQMIPGYWTFQIFDGDHVLFEKEFEVFVENSVEEEKDEDYFYDL
ncbi:MAG TPA: DUF3859 domain-containing protein [Cytophagaceae bacterium]|jgi:hypothetical protein